MAPQGARGLTKAPRDTQLFFFHSREYFFLVVELANYESEKRAETILESYRSIKKAIPTTQNRAQRPTPFHTFW